jgi:hypothetical protein
MGSEHECKQEPTINELGKKLDRILIIAYVLLGLMLGQGGKSIGELVSTASVATAAASEAATHAAE